jgi:hypothetical protein
VRRAANRRFCGAEAPRSEALSASPTVRERTYGFGVRLVYTEACSVVVSSPASAGGSQMSSSDRAGREDRRVVRWGHHPATSDGFSVRPRGPLTNWNPTTSLRMLPQDVGVSIGQSPEYGGSFVLLWRLGAGTTPEPVQTPPVPTPRSGRPPPNDRGPDQGTSDVNSRAYRDFRACHGGRARGKPHGLCAESDGCERDPNI